MTKVNFSGLTDGLAIQITVSLFVGMLIATPVWLYQIWAFVVPGLTKRESVTLWFLVSSTPLFPHRVLAGLSHHAQSDRRAAWFHPEGAANITPAAGTSTSSSRFHRRLGVAFRRSSSSAQPRRAGLGGAAPAGLARAVMAIMVFAAVITPTVDPHSMFPHRPAHGCALLPRMGCARSWTAAGARPELARHPGRRGLGDRRPRRTVGAVMRPAYRGRRQPDVRPGAEPPWRRRGGPSAGQRRRGRRPVRRLARPLDRQRPRCGRLRGSTFSLSSVAMVWRTWGSTPARAPRWVLAIIAAGTGNDNAVRSACPSVSRSRPPTSSPPARSGPSTPDACGPPTETGGWINPSAAVSTRSSPSVPPVVLAQGPMRFQPRRGP